MPVFEIEYDKKSFSLSMKETTYNPSTYCFVTFQIKKDLLLYTERGNVTIWLDIKSMPTGGYIKFQYSYNPTKVDHLRY